MWPAVARLLAPAVEATNGCYEIGDVLGELKTGRQQLWVDWEEGQKINAAMTTAIGVYPRKKSLRVIFIGGSKMRKWLPEFRDLIEKNARSNGATMIEGFFREGWVRVWPGARVSGVGLVKEL